MSYFIYRQISMTIPYNKSYKTITRNYNLAFTYRDNISHVTRL